jgi:hypothetical protein
MKSSLCLLAIATITLSAPTFSNETDPHLDGCRYMPADAGWPSAAQWTLLNETVGGQLIATVPLAASCHDAIAPKKGLHKDWPSYDENECTVLQERWLEPELQYAQRSFAHHCTID